MVNEVLTNVFAAIMIYLSPIVFMVGAFTVANKIIEIIKNSFGAGRVKRAYNNDW